MTDNCRGCKKPKKGSKNNFCFSCQGKRQNARALQDIVDGLKPASEYNRYLFELFLTNTRRYQILNSIVRQARILKDLLEKTSLPPILSWPQLYELRRVHEETVPVRRCTHPLLRIGLMLQELGVIEPRSEMRQRRFERLLTYFDSATGSMLTEFADTMRSLRRSENTILAYWRCLHDFQKWSESSTGGTLLTATTTDLQRYLSELAVQRDSQKSVRNAYFCLHRFYRWCLARKKILLHPLAGIDPPRMPPRRHVVCGEEDLSRLIIFIKNPDSPPDLAMLVVLILFWGLSVQELIRAQLQTDGENLEIHFRQRLPTYQQRSRRPEKLTLPSSPRWFLELQKRYFTYWQSIYAKAKKNFPGRPLFLHPLGHHNRPMSHLWVATRANNATLLATGKVVPLSVLRQTCAQMHVRGNDAGVLQDLGWSSQSAFIYTWAPYHVHDGKKRRSRRIAGSRPTEKV